MFGCFCFGNGIFVWFFIKETKGRSLEDMDILFGTVDENERKRDVQRVLEKVAVEHEHDEGVEMPAGEKV